MSPAAASRPRSPVAVAATVLPVVGVLVLVLTWSATPGPVLQALVALVLVGAVLSAVHHAEVVAHRVGEPFGSLLLAVAVTVIEVGLIITLMVSGAEGARSLARDTAFAALMITTNGIAGLVLVIGAAGGRVARFNPAGAATALSAALALATVSLVLPRFTTTESAPTFSTSQLVFAASASAVVYGLFVLVQNVRHRDYFLPERGARPALVEGGAGPGAGGDGGDEHAETPAARTALASAAMLVLALVAVVGLAKVESPAISAAVAGVGFPPAFVGVVIAVLVLAPETLAAVRNAAGGRLQIGLNLAYGSALASIGLTIPAVVVASFWLSGDLVLGLGSLQIALLALTAVVSVLTVLPGRATVLQGGLHLMLCAAFLYFAAVP